MQSQYRALDYRASRVKIGSFYPEVVRDSVISSNVTITSPLRCAVITLYFWNKFPIFLVKRVIRVVTSKVTKLCLLCQSYAEKTVDSFFRTR